MLFSSSIFIYVFLPFVLFVDLVVLKKNRVAQNVFLLLASLYFYAWGEPKFVFVMMASIVINWFCGLMIDKNRDKKLISRLILATAVFFDLVILFIFKYLGFSENVMNSAFGLNMKVHNIALPIGISFFTFQAISYVVDVYRKKGEVQTNILYVGLYISFFPQLIAGPIVRYETVADQIKNRKETLEDLFEGFITFVVGLSKKVLLANSLAVVADQAFSYEGGKLSVLFSWLGVVTYSLQLFFDFGGYSDMAIGLGRMFGFHFLENFKYPYISKSITDFWRRWHISLATWFRDYLYIPLGGSRCGKVRNVFNIFMVWLFTGIWHGANYTYIGWGMINFALLMMERSTGIHKKEGKITGCVMRVYTLLCISVSMVVFRANSISHAITYLKSMFGLNGNKVSDGIFVGWFTQNLLIIIVSLVLATPIIKNIGIKYRDNKAFGWGRVALYVCLFVLSVASLTGSAYNPFIYFNF